MYTCTMKVKKEKKGKERKGIYCAGVNLGDD